MSFATFALALFSFHYHSFFFFLLAQCSFSFFAVVAINDVMSWSLFEFSGCNLVCRRWHYISLCKTHPKSYYTHEPMLIFHIAAFIRLQSQWMNISNYKWKIHSFYCSSNHLRFHRSSATKKKQITPTEKLQSKCLMCFLLRYYYYGYCQLSVMRTLIAW